MLVKININISWSVVQSCNTFNIVRRLFMPHTFDIFNAKPSCNRLPMKIQNKIPMPPSTYSQYVCKCKLVSCAILWHLQASFMIIHATHFGYFQCKALLWSCCTLYTFYKLYTMNIIVVAAYTELKSKHHCRAVTAAKACFVNDGPFIINLDEQLLSAIM